MKGFSRAVVAALIGLVAAAPTPNPVIEDRAAKVSVAIAPSSTVVGASTLGVEKFSGIPYAVPPVGPLRLKPPVRLTASLGTFDATGIEAACPQFLLSTGGNSLITQVLGNVLDLPFFQTVTKQSEDCLTINVIRPAGVKAGDNLPVLFWIFGGGFELGWTSMYDGSSLVSNAVNAGKPFVFVAVNYRVGGFGFLPGKEILQDGSANLGLLDQRMGLEWAADNIAAFGGDPSKVTIWGESAGSISVLDQMVLYGGNNQYNGKPLFRGAIMNSGSIVPADPVDCPKGQVVYDTVVRAAGCSSSTDTLACLRSADYTTFLNAANSVPGILSYNSVALSYLPRPDGTAITDSPDVLVLSGKYAAVPMIIGDQEDEGTLFSLFQSNTTTTSALIDYLNNIFFHDATREQIAALVATYDDSITAGSPFRTGIFNEVYPGFKRLAAILGDLVFQLTRRAFLTGHVAINPSVPAWSYMASYDYGTPILGSFHGSDLLQVFYGILPNAASKSIQSYYANFVYNLDPNDASGGTGTGTKVALGWPQWKDGNQLVQFFNIGSTLIKDDFRSGTFNWIVGNIPYLRI
ncbi:alpha/beta-hydrolase [Coniochaeta ligniaria NRRL 30616]|uniref:Carboxylic ester hydrolase n=1 Tax=Coniochaeta ligniaria NRRL 30616 TaxID=1408157 RepID=A0A1J7IZB7_9PEZI|nr:alpha/beta-hydrolase [Coniochaeta ligniaria NRRL 30616]